MLNESIYKSDPKIEGLLLLISLDGKERNRFWIWGLELSSGSG